VPVDRYDRYHEGDRAEDYRTPGQRDRDRVLYTSALRRLGAVTQVVSPTEGVLFHNRLTHTLEVAQIARRMAERLGEEQEQTTQNVGGIDPDVVEAAALVHDLGHPPFGHAVEDELDILVRAADVMDGFEGNAQSFRIATKLATRNVNFPGLNLTRATLNATLKYPWGRATSGYAQRKWGAYGTERDEFDFARESHPAGNTGRSVEAELMDWADDIAYAVHDVEDFYRVGLIPLDRLRSDLQEVQRFVRKAVQHLSEEVPRYQALDSSDLVDAMVEAFKEAVWSGPTLEPYRATRRQRAGLRTYTSGRINNYVNAIEIIPDREPGHQVQKTSEAEDQVNILKQLTRIYVIENPALETQQHGQRQIVEVLFGIYLKAVREGDETGVIPPGYREEVEDADGDEERVRIVADMISSMTEEQLQKTHRRLTGLSPGSVMDIIQ
jgi:dGTPase